MTSKEDILSYLRANLKDLARRTWLENIDFGNNTTKVMNTIRDTIIFIESTYPENQARETD